MFIVFRYFDLLAIVFVVLLVVFINSNIDEPQDKVLAICMVLYLAIALPRCIYYQKDEVYVKEQILKLEELLDRAYAQSDSYQRKYENLLKEIHPYGEDDSNL